MADVAGFAARKAEAAKRGKLRGLGYASLHRGVRHRAVEHRRRARRARRACSKRARCACIRPAASRSSPARTATARATRRPSRRSSRRASASRSRTSTIVHGDTGRVPFGMGTYGSRSLAVGGTAIVKALDKIDRQGQEDRRAPARGGARPTSSSRTASSRSRAPTAARRSARSRSTAYVPHNYPLDKLEPGLERERRSTIRPTSPSRPARTSARSRSIPTPACVQVVAFTARATTSATSSTR